MKRLAVTQLLLTTEAVTFNDKIYFFQRGYEPLVYDNAGGSVIKLSTSGAAGVASATYGNNSSGWSTLDG